MPLRRSFLVLMLALALLATAPLAPAASGSVQLRDPRPALEPSSGFGLGVRLIRITGDGATRRALVELNLFSREELANLRVDRSSGIVPGESTSVALPGNSRRLMAWNARKVQLSLDLEEGRIHHLRFEATGEARAGGSRRATAYLRVNLDPESMGRRLDMEDHDLIQYGPAGGGQ